MPPDGHAQRAPRRRSARRGRGRPPRGARSWGTRCRPSGTASGPQRSTSAHSSEYSSRKVVSRLRPGGRKKRSVWGPPPDQSAPASTLTAPSRPASGRILGERQGVLGVEHHHGRPAGRRQQPLHERHVHLEPVGQLRGAHPEPLEDARHGRRAALHGLARDGLLGGRREVGLLAPVAQRQLARSGQRPARRTARRRSSARAIAAARSGRRRTRRGHGRPSGNSWASSSSAVSRMMPATSGENGAGCA